MSKYFQRHPRAGGDPEGLDSTFTRQGIGKNLGRLTASRRSTDRRGLFRRH